MTSLWQAPAIAVVITWLTAPPGSLGQAGRQEALRRAMVARAVASFSLYDWPAAAAAESATKVSAPPIPAAPEATSIQPTGGARPTASTASPSTAGEDPKRDETWWRERMAAARAALARDQTLADAMQSHINALRADVVSRDDPAQQAALRERLATALAELDRLTRQIAADRQAIVAIEDDARRRGVPAGWIRDEEPSRRLEERRRRVSASGRSP